MQQLALVLVLYKTQVVSFLSASCCYSSKCEQTAASVKTTATRMLLQELNVIKTRLFPCACATPLQTQAYFKWYFVNNKGV